MNNKRYLILASVLILLLAIVLAITVFRNRDLQSPDEVIVSNDGEIVENTNNETPNLNVSESQIQAGYTELFTVVYSKAWLDRFEINVDRPYELYAQGTDTFRNYYESARDNLALSANTAQYFEPELDTYHIVSQSSELVTTQISGTLVTETPGQTQRTSTTVTLELIPTNSDYLIDSVTVE
jgi:hypothetical protein